MCNPKIPLLHTNYMNTRLISMTAWLLMSHNTFDNNLGHIRSLPSIIQHLLLLVHNLHLFWDKLATLITMLSKKIYTYSRKEMIFADELQFKQLQKRNLTSSLNILLLLFCNFFHKYHYYIYTWILVTD